MNTLDEIGKLPIFKLSLGSKELFHSNFLEYLWYCRRKADGNYDRYCFIKMIRTLLQNEQILTGDADKYILSREKENFDVCIYHKEGKKEVYDLIIENKVKSIPYKEQLKEYVGKVAKKKQQIAPSYLLLSLAKEFPDKGNTDVIDVSVMLDNKVISGPWKVVDYFSLKEAIWAQEGWRKESFVEEYCTFIECLDRLGGEILDSIGKEFLFPNVEVFKKERIHDLYIKMRCSWFVTALKNRLEKEIGPGKVKIISKFDDRSYGCVNLNVAMNQGNGQIAAWICDSDNKDKDGKPISNTFEIVIQGDQYRHGINQMDINPEEAKTMPKIDRLNALYDRIENGLDDCDPFLFLNFAGEFNCFDFKSKDIRPDANKKVHYFRNKDKTEKSGPFDCYSDSYIYRYGKINNYKDETFKVDKLLETMVADIKRIYYKTPDLITEKQTISKL